MLERDAEARSWSARGFGTRPGDVEHPVDASRPATAVARLLGACLRDAHGNAPADEEVASWSVQRRLDGLIAIRLAGAGSEQRVESRCGECGAAFEVSIDLAACRAEISDAPVEFTATDGSLRRARLPTGSDQARWHAESTPIAAAAASLLEPPGPGPVDEATLAALDRALASRDALRELSLEVACPDCGAASTQVLNLEDRLLRGFATAQERLLAEIDALARAYHWSESEIAAMPAWRRAFYLQRLSHGGGA